MITDENFDAYVEQLLLAVRTSEDDIAKQLIADLLGEFRERAYCDGRHMLIDNLRLTLNKHDDRRFAALADSGSPTVSVNE